MDRHTNTNGEAGNAAGKLARIATGIAAGSLLAETELYRTLGAEVVGWARRYSDSPEDAEDLASDCWELVLGKLRAGELRDPERVRGYFAGVVRRLAAGRRRRLCTRLERCDTEAVERAGAAPVCAQPERMVAREEFRTLTGNAIDTLSMPRDRQLLRELLLHEATPAQLAPTLAMSPTHLHKVACRARQRLRDALIRLQPTSDWLREAD